MSRRKTILLAFAAGATVANLYYAQPLLAQIGADFGVRAAAVSIVVTATQLGYAAGLLLLVPLGDALERRRLIVTTTVFIVGALLLVAASRSLTWLIVSSFVLGAATIVPQLLVPLAAHLASDEERGKVVGTVMSGLLIGIILSRSISGFLAGAIGWRTTYVVAAVAMALLAIVLRLALPPEPPAVEIRYGALLRSMATLVRHEPVLQRHAIIGACGFGAFSVFWTTLAFRLLDLSPAYGPATVGAFGVIGVTGALVAPLAGRVAHRYGPLVMNGSGLVTIVLSFALMAVSGHSLALLAIAVILLDAGSQASHVSNQTQIFAMGGELRNRVNAVYMVSFFVGGALGSTLGGIVWQHGGWYAVCATGAALAAIGLATLLASMKR